MFDTVSDLKKWLEEEDNIKSLVVGQNVCFKARNVADLWWTGTEFLILETEKVDLSGVVVTDDL